MRTIGLNPTTQSNNKECTEAGTDMQIYGDSGQKYFGGLPHPKPKIVVGWLIGA